MSAALRFLVLAELLGLAALPLTSVALARLPALAAPAAKPLGLLLAGWIAWLGTVAGLDHGPTLDAAGLAAVAVAGLAVWRQRPGALREAVRGSRLWAPEAVFLAAFAAMALIVAHAPDVWGTEKPMDMALINAIAAGDSLPPHNPWLAGEALDGYYWFGHLLCAIVIGLAGVEPTVGYNLSLALFFGLASTTAFGLGAAIATLCGRAGGPWGVVAVALLLVAGNLAAALELIRHDGPLAQYPWFEASRVVPGTINEFPFFSWLLGDLHAHLLAVPFTLLALAFALQWLAAGARPADVAAAAIVSGLLYAINSWSYPVVTGLLLVALVASTRGGIRSAVAAGGLLLAGGLAVLPFALGFEPPAGGIEPVTRRTPLGRFAIDLGLLLGLLAWLVAGAYAAALWRLGASRRALAAAGAAALALSLLALLGDMAGAGVLVLAAGFAFVRVMRARGAAAESFLWLSAFGACVCLALPELVFVSDSFAGSDLERMNTVFKLGYHAWLLLALAGTAALALSPGWGPRLVRRAWWAGALALALAAAVFPLAGSYARTGGFSSGPTLDGLGWLRATAPGDVEAIAWLRERTPGHAVVLETAGDDYSSAGHARISTFTGRATVIGWQGHVLQWGADPAGRRADVEALYRGTDPAAARELAARHGIDYVIVGPLELSDHGSAGTRKWDVLGTRVFDRSGTTIWRLAG